MLESLDFQDRKMILEMMYSDFVEEKSKHVSHGITSAEVISEWENFRYKWLHENLIDKLNGNN